VADAKGNPWGAIHSPLMEYDELMLERAGSPARIRASGFVRMAWIDETDGSTQYARAYLPTHYDPAKKWPMVIQLHGFNPPNPPYWRWWGVDSRHWMDSELPEHEGIIYIEPHGRGNVQHVGFAVSDILRAIAEAKRLFTVDEDRVYLTGESMGGWGVWNVATRHPELFAAIAPVHGGVDYHSQMWKRISRSFRPSSVSCRSDRAPGRWRRAWSTRLSTFITETSTRRSTWIGRAGA